MLPSYSSPRVVLENRTNVFRTPTRRKLSLALLTPPEDARVKRRVVSDGVGRPKKRFKLDISEEKESSSESEEESDTEMEDVTSVQARMRNHTVFLQGVRASTGNPAAIRTENASTRLLQSFVSSNKSDVFRCQSTDVNAYLTPPYACAYTHGAKNGGMSLLAVATEQGSIHVMNTSRRRDWDCEPPRTTLQPHDNGIFDAKWSTDDAFLATCSGDQSISITDIATEVVIHTLRGHTSTVKCVAWNPQNPNMLSTGAREGTICIWDLRTAGRHEGGSSVLNPVIELPGAHGKAKARRGKNAPALPSVTHLAYPEVEPYGLISSGSSDGILKYWDLRSSTNRKSRTTKQKQPQAIFLSPFDPTMLYGSRRSRGIIRFTMGTGPTAGLVFALGADSRIHTYTLPALEPQTLCYEHEGMQTNSFYVGLALSPCGRWITSGGTGTKGSAFLFDVSNSARPWLDMKNNRNGVELRGQRGEIGGIDWAEGALATCADDGTVRVWRPDIEIYRSCQDNSEDSHWDWSWAIGDTREL